jgi:uncharacterized protein YbjT (DUF2867 family)
MADDLVALTGVTGAVGSRVAANLSASGARLRLIARDPGRCPDITGAEAVAGSYDDQEAMTRALEGVDVFFLVSGREDKDRLEHHRRTVAGAAAAGVEKIVYLSFLGAAPNATFTLARQHYQTEQYIRDTGARFVFLRDNLYTDFVPYFAGVDGVIRGPAGEGRVGFVTRDDIGQAAARVVISSDFDGSTFDVTGPEAIDLHETADRFGRFIGRTVTYHPETVDEAYASRSVYNAPDWEVDGWVTSYLAIANGELDVVSDAVEQLTGHPAQTLEDFLTAHPESYLQHLE